MHRRNPRLLYVAIALFDNWKCHTEKTYIKYKSVLCFTHINGNLITILLLQVGIIISWIIMLKVFLHCLIFSIWSHLHLRPVFLFQVTNERNSLLKKVPYLFESRFDTFHWVALNWEPSYRCYGRKSHQTVAFSSGAMSTQRLRPGKAGSQHKLCRHKVRNLA